MKKLLLILLIFLISCEEQEIKEALITSEYLTAVSFLEEDVDELQLKIDRSIFVKNYEVNIRGQIKEIGYVDIHKMILLKYRVNPYNKIYICQIKIPYEVQSSYILINEMNDSFEKLDLYRWKYQRYIFVMSFDEKEQSTIIEHYKN